MPSHKIPAALLLSICLLLLKPRTCFGWEQQQQDIPALLQELTSLSPDPCLSEEGKVESAGSPDTVRLLFDRTADAVLQQLNEPGTAYPKDRAAEALIKIEKLSAETNAAWPAESRFHFQVIDLSASGVAIKTALRTNSTFYVFGLAAQDDHGNPNRTWHRVAAEEPPTPFTRHSIILYPLHRGPSGNGRFLASIQTFGCAGSVGISYDAREWSPSGTGSLEQIAQQDGSLGLDDKVPGFPQIGKLQTHGTLITLPYCWFSSLDTWDNPSLCAVDTYDLSGDDIAFHARRYNRPDLVPIAKAIEYAQHHDYRAVLGYCASAQVARRLVRNSPMGLGAEDLQIISTGVGRKRVKLSDEGYSFDLEKRAGIWVITDFKSK